MYLNYWNRFLQRTGYSYSLHLIIRKVNGSNTSGTFFTSLSFLQALRYIVQISSNESQWFLNLKGTKFLSAEQREHWKKKTHVSGVSVIYTSKNNWWFSKTSGVSISTKGLIKASYCQIASVNKTPSKA